MTKHKERMGENLHGKKIQLSQTYTLDIFLLEKKKG